jgi:hypothetical protein
LKTRSLWEYLGPRGMRLWEKRRLHNEEFHSLYRSPKLFSIIKSRRLRWAGRVARMEEGRSAFKILTGKPTGKRPRHRWDDNIRMDLKEIDINTRNWVDAALDRDYWTVPVNAALNLQDRVSNGSVLSRHVRELITKTFTAII